MTKIIDLSKITNKKILAIGAHSDDLEFGAGGSLLNLGKQNQVKMIIATDGRLGVHEFEADAEALVQKRMSEARKSGEMIGAEVIFWMYPDWGLSERKKHLTKKIVKLMLRERPDIVISFDPWGKYEPYIHPDHRTLAWAVVEGIMLATLPRWVEKHALGRRMLHPKPQTWLMMPGEANTITDVTGHWEERVKLIEVFESQFDNHSQKDEALEWVENVSSEWGSKVGIKYGEAFKILDYGGEWDTNE